MLRRLCELPMEVIVYILNFLECEEAIQTINVCDHFKSGVCYLIRLQLINLRRRITNEISLCQLNLCTLPLSQESLRMELVKLLTFLRFLLTEIEIMFALVWRYRSVSDVWSQLCPLIVPVMKEFNTNIAQQVSLPIGRLDLNFRVYNVFPKWNEFLIYFENEFSERLNCLMPFPINFGLMAVDILACCPSINFQIAFDLVKIHNIENDTYISNGAFNIYSFFKLNHLKPSCQIPNVHNAELSNTKKQFQLMKYLRECVQWENTAYLQHALTEMYDLEIRLFTSFDEPRRDYFIKELQNNYTNVQSVPYEPIFESTKLSYVNDEKHCIEYYYRFSSSNESITGLRCIVDLNNQSLENLPLIYSTLNNFKNPLYKTILTNDLITFDDSKSSNENSMLQLIIIYRERANSSPGQAIINVCYDEKEENQLTIYNIESEPYL